MVDTFLGLPAHPLIVHLPVVLLPLVALGVIAVTLRPSWRPRFAVALLGLLAVAALASGAAVLSGNALAERVGLPATHQSFGTALAIASGVALLTIGPWLWAVRRDAEPTRGQNLAGGLASLAAVALLVLTVLTGHSGATAAWSGVVADSPTPPATTPAAAPGEGEASPTPTPSPMGTPTQGTSTPATESPTPSPRLTMEEVALHASAESCWAAIEGRVYDLTDWVDQHPGGSDRILGICGTDATAAFARQHDGDQTPAQRLAMFLLGDLEQ